MSLEQAIAENTAAMRELIAVLASAKAAPAAAAVEPAPKKPAAKAAEKPAEAPKAEPKANPQTGVDYAPVGAAITAYAAANGRDATLAKLAELGVKSGKELKPDQYAAALAAFSAEEEVA